MALVVKEESVADFHSIDVITPAQALFSVAKRHFALDSSGTTMGANASLSSSQRSIYGIGTNSISKTGS